MQLLWKRNRRTKTGLYLYRKEWNYFSAKDGVKSKLRVCESCFDEWTKQFVIPPLMEEVTEIV